MHIRSRSRSNLTILTMIVTVGVLMATLSTTMTSMSIAKAQLGNGQPPISVVGNPHGFSTGPPIPSCQVANNQGPLDNGHIHGCRGTP